MFTSFIMSIVLALSSAAFVPASVDASFFQSNVDAQAILEENNFASEEEIQDYVLNYIASTPTTYNNSDNDVSQSILDPEQYLKDEYGDYTWHKVSKRLTSDVSNAIPLNMKGQDFPASDFDEAVDRSGISSSYGGCGSIAMVGIFDYFARYLGYDTIMRDPTLSEDRIRLVTDVFREVSQFNVGKDTIVFPWDYKSACDTLIKRYGLKDVISCDSKGTLLSGGIKGDLLKIITEKIDEGLPVTMYTGLLSGSGNFAEHYTNIYGYEKWVGSKSNGEVETKYLLEARLNLPWANDNIYFCDDDILDTGMMGIIYYDINYENSHSIVASDFAEEFVNSAGQGQYFYYEKTTPVTTASGYTFNTSRLRCSYIENQYLVLSTNRSGVVDAYLELDLPNYVQRLTFTSSLWSSMEAMGDNGHFSIQIYKGNQWQDYIVYDVKSMSLLKNYPNSHLVLFPIDTTKIRFYAKHDSPSGDRNNGRIVIDNIVIEYN